MVWTLDDRYGNMRQLGDWVDATVIVPAREIEKALVNLKVVLI